MRAVLTRNTNVSGGFVNLPSLLVAVLVLGVSGCLSPTAPDPGKPNFFLSCAGIPNGGVVGVTISPTSWTLDRSLNQTITEYGHVWRDDPNTPGTQFYCEDLTITINFIFPYPSYVREIAEVTPKQHATAMPGPYNGTIGEVRAQYGGFVATSHITVVP